MAISLLSCTYKIVSCRKVLMWMIKRDFYTPNMNKEKHLCFKKLVKWSESNDTITDGHCYIVCYFITIYNFTYPKLRGLLSTWILGCIHWLFLWKVGTCWTLPRPSNIVTSEWSNAGDQREYSTVTRLPRPRLVVNPEPWQLRRWCINPTEMSRD